jgi:hypothetical protein
MNIAIMLLLGIALFALFFKSINSFEIFKTMTALFIVAIVVFCYMSYVLLKPEKF